MVARRSYKAQSVPEGANIHISVAKVLPTTVTNLFQRAKNSFLRISRLTDLREPAATRCTRSMTEPAARAAAVGVCTSFQTFCQNYLYLISSHILVAFQNLCSYRVGVNSPAPARQPAATEFVEKQTSLASFKMLRNTNRGKLSR